MARDCVLGLDIGTTSTIGALIAPPDEILAVAARPIDAVARRTRAGRRKIPRNGGTTPARSCASSDRRRVGAVARHLRGICVTGMLPALVLLDEAGGVIRPSIQQSDGRCGAEVAELARRGRRGRVPAPRPATASISSWSRRNCAGSQRHEPGASRASRTVFGSYDYINWRLTGRRGDRAQLGAGGRASSISPTTRSTTISSP